MEKAHFMGMSIQDKVDIYETFTIPNLKRLIVKLAKDIPQYGLDKDYCIFGFRICEKRIEI